MHGSSGGVVRRSGIPLVSGKKQGQFIIVHDDDDGRSKLSDVGRMRKCVVFEVELIIIRE